MEPVWCGTNVNSEALSQACLPRCSRNTRSRSRSLTAFRLVSTECSEALSRCESKWKPGRKANSPTSPPRWSSTRRLWRGELEAPKHLARTVHDLYFQPKYEEFRPRTIWSLSNAFTSAFKELDPIPQFKARAKLGEFLEARFSQSF